MTPLPPEARRTRGFQIFTCDGSCFLARFDPLCEDEDIDEVYGRLTVIGRPRGAGADIRITGIGVVPCAGGRIITSSDPERTYTMNGELIQERPYEVIARVVEFPVPTSP